MIDQQKTLLGTAVTGGGRARHAGPRAACAADRASAPLAARPAHHRGCLWRMTLGTRRRGRDSAPTARRRPGALSRARHAAARWARASPISAGTGAATISLVPRTQRLGRIEDPTPMRTRYAEFDSRQGAGFVSDCRAEKWRIHTPETLSAKRIAGLSASNPNFSLALPTRTELHALPGALTFYRPGWPILRPYPVFAPDEEDLPG